MSSAGMRTANIPISLLIIAVSMFTVMATLSSGSVAQAHAEAVTTPATSYDVRQSAAADEPSQSDSAPESPAALSAQISADERVVVLKARDASLAAARSVAFNVWSERSGREQAITHDAIRCDDGTWLATLYIASPTPLEPGVPYNCRIDHAIHRLFNPASGQHLFTGDVNEADTLSRIGWSYEGVAWVDVDGASSRSNSVVQPVYRLYNPSSAEHFYTADANEYATLPHYGWTQEGVAFYSDPDKAQPIYRLYDPNSAQGFHHFTADANEYATLGSRGWNQEGVSWCGAAFNAEGSWSLSGGNRPHDDSGLYHVEGIATFYDEPAIEAQRDAEVSSPGEAAVPTDAQPAADDVSASDDNAVFTDAVIGQTSFFVTPPTATAAVANVDDNGGSFDVIIGDIRSVSGVTRLTVPVWAADDQGDLRQYSADRQADGTYKVTVRARDHRALSHYTIEATLIAGNGVRENVAHTNCDLALSNFIYLEGGPRIYTLSVVNMDPAGSVTMPTWSEANGQDDIVWYEAAFSKDRWSATIDTGNFLDSGRCITHIYADGQCRGSFEFAVSPQEVLTLRQRAILKAAREVPTLGGGLCAGWVSTVLMRAGQPYNMADDANDMYYRLPLTDLSSLLPGMAIAVSTHGHTIAGSIWGHVGIYLGDDQVIDDAYGSIRIMPLEQWVAFYTDRVPVHFGFLEY